MTLVKQTTERRGTILDGVVVSDKMMKTAVVEVTRMVRHPKYRKFMKLRKRFKAENPENGYKIGDRVRMQSCRPLSKDKHFCIVAKLGQSKDFGVKEWADKTDTSDVTETNITK